MKVRKLMNRIMPERNTPGVVLVINIITLDSLQTHSPYKRAEAISNSIQSLFLLNTTTIIKINVLNKDSCTCTKRSYRTSKIFGCSCVIIYLLKYPYKWCQWLFGRSLFEIKLCV